MERSTEKRETIEFLTNFQKFGYKGRLETAKILFEKIQNSDDLELQKYVIIELIQILISYTEDLEAWFFYTKDRGEQDIDHRVWEYLMRYKSSPKTRKKFFEEIMRINNSQEFMTYFGFQESDLLTNTKMSKEIINDMIIEGVIIKAFQIAANNRTNKDGLLIRAFNKIKHHYLILDSSGPQVIIRDDTNILKVDINIDEAKKLLNTSELIARGIFGIITTLMCEFSGFISKFGLAENDRSYYLNKKVSGENDPIKAIINPN